MELIKVSQQVVGAEETKTVNARELHGFLESRQDFSTWVKNRITKYGFVEGLDFVRVELSAGLAMPDSGGNVFDGVSPQKNGALETSTYNFGQQGRIEYLVTLDMAKELSMVENNEQGKKARRYFIECERLAKSAPTLPNFANPAEAARAWADAEDARVAALAQLETIAPKAAALDRLSAAEGDMCVTDVAKALQMKRKDLFQYLSENRWIYKRAGNGNWIGYQEKIQSGLLRHGEHTVTRSDGSDKLVNQVYITPKGQAKLAVAFGVTA